jgi:hypothetical protein
MKNIISFLVFTLFIQCASVNLVREPLTDRDKDKVSNLEEIKKKGIHIINERAGIISNSDTPELRGYRKILNSLTMELVDNLGGVEVIEADSSRNLKDEADMVKKVKSTDLAENQATGTDNFDDVKEIEKLEKLFQERKAYQIGTRLTKADLNIVYHPPETYTDKKTGETKTTDPYWTVTVTAGVNFTVKNAEGVVIYSQVLTNHYSKAHSEEPNNSVIDLYLPKAINYCFEDAKPELQSLFPMKSYVIAMKGDKKYAMVLGGSQNKIRKGRTFDIVNTDPSPDAQHTSIKIFQVSANESWGEISGNAEDVKIGKEVMLRPQPPTIFDKIWRFIESNLGL